MQLKITINPSHQPTIAGTLFLWLGRDLQKQITYYLIACQKTQSRFHHWNPLSFAVVTIFPDADFFWGLYQGESHMKLHRLLFLQLVLIFYHPQQRTLGNPIPVWLQWPQHQACAKQDHHHKRSLEYTDGRGKSWWAMVEKGMSWFDIERL